MSSSTTNPLPGSWTKDVISRNHDPALTYSQSAEHLMETLEVRAWWAEDLEMDLATEYRQWQFNTEHKSFVARCAIGRTGTPTFHYPNIACTDVYDLFQSRGKSVPQWIINLTKAEYLKWTLRSSELDSCCSKSRVSW